MDEFFFADVIGEYELENAKPRPTSLSLQDTTTIDNPTEQAPLQKQQADTGELLGSWHGWQQQGQYAVLGEHVVARTGKPVTETQEGHACNAKILKDRCRVLSCGFCAFVDAS